MLILSRKLGQSIRLPGQNVTVHVVAVTGRTVRLGVEAPPEVTILRSELEAAPAAAALPPTAPPSRDLPPRDLEELCSALDRLADRLSAAERNLAAQDDRAGANPLADLTEELQQTRRALARIAGCGGATSLAC